MFTGGNHRSACSILEDENCRRRRYGEVVGRFRRAMAYFEAFNSGDPDRFRDFTLQHRTQEWVVATPMEKRLGNYSRRREEWGGLELREYAVTGPQELSVLVDSTIGALTYTFTVAAEPPHKLSGISISN